MEKYIPYKLALKFKEKGFDAPVFYWIDEVGNDGYMYPNHKQNINIPFLVGKTSIPTYEQVKDWFIQKHNLQLFLDYSYYDGFHYGYKWVKSNGAYGIIWKDNNGEDPDGSIDEATIYAFEEALKLI